jgi:predicted kinase
MNKLIIICGLSFAGKTTLGQALARRLGYEQVDVDDIKTTLYGPEVKDDELTKAEWERIYEETDKQIIDQLRSGATVIDASRNFTRAERKHIKKLVNSHGYEVVTIYLNISERVARQRWQKNRENPSRRDVTDTDFEDIVRAMEPPMADEQPLIVYANEKIERWIAEHHRVLT